LNIQKHSIYYTTRLERLETKYCVLLKYFSDHCICRYNSVLEHEGTFTSVPVIYRAVNVFHISVRRTFNKRIYASMFNYHFHSSICLLL